MKIKGFRVATCNRYSCIITVNQFIKEIVSIKRCSLPLKENKLTTSVRRF